MSYRRGSLTQLLALTFFLRHERCTNVEGTKLAELSHIRNDGVRAHGVHKRALPSTWWGTHRSLSVAGNCSDAGDSVFVNSTIEHIGGCYVNTDESLSSGLPIFVKDGNVITSGSSILVFSNGSSSYLPSATSSAEPDGLFTWSILYLDYVSEDDWDTYKTMCSTQPFDDLVDPTDPSLLGTWTCSNPEVGDGGDEPADFDGVTCEPGCNVLEVVVASDNSSDDSEDADVIVMTILYAILTVAAIVLVTAFIIWFLRRTGT